MSVPSDPPLTSSEPLARRQSALTPYKDQMRIMQELRHVGERPYTQAMVPGHSMVPGLWCQVTPWCLVYKPNKSSTVSIQVVLGKMLPGLH